jgi:IstB-like ATP binding protein
VRDLAGGAFIAQQRNVVLVGGTGTGKTHLARISHHGQYGTCQRGDYGRFGGRAQEGVTLLAR